MQIYFLNGFWDLFFSLLNDLRQIQKLYFQIIQNYMEKQESSFVVTPSSIVLNSSDEIIKFSVKNTGNRSVHYEIMILDMEHFKLTCPRSFSLAPGITKFIKIQHVYHANKCTAFPQIIQIVDGNGVKNYVHLKCFKNEHTEEKKVQLQETLILEKLTVNEQRNVEIPLTNRCGQNFRVKIRHSTKNSPNTIVFTIENQIILLKNSTKILFGCLKILKELQFSVKIYLEFTQEITKQKWQQQITISGNTLLKSQFVADNQLNKIQSISYELLNGTSLEGTIYLVNRYNKDCQFKLLEKIEIVDYKSYCEKLEEISLNVQVRSGVVSAKSEKKIDFVLTAMPNDNDLSFTKRYSQLAIKDEQNSYKLRNSNYFRKNLQVLLKIQFGEDHQINFRIKAQVVNPAIRFMKNKPFNNIETLDILNDSGLDIPFKFINNMYFLSKPSCGKFKTGINQVDIQWKNSNSKENTLSVFKGEIKVELSKNYEILMNDAMIKQRPKSSLLRTEGFKRQTFKETINIRAPKKLGDIGIKTIKQITTKDYLNQSRLKYFKWSDLNAQELKHLQVNRNQKGIVLTNSHKDKNILITIPQKGDILLEKQYSYLIPYDQKISKFICSNKEFSLQSKEPEDKQSYKINNRELLFCFNQNQKEFQIIKEFQVVNKSNQYLIIYCLSIDDYYFHSIEQDHKIIVPPKTTMSYKISFFPKAELQFKNKNQKITRKLQFLIDNQKQFIYCEGDLLSYNISIEQSVILLKNCLYSENQIVKNIVVHNKGINKANFYIERPSCFDISPQNGVISEKTRQILSLSFCPAKLSKAYKQNLVIYFKGSHVVRIPVEINIKLPEVEVQQQVIDFKTGYFNERISGFLTIINKNLHPCKLKFNYEENKSLTGPRDLQILEGQSKKIEFILVVQEIGFRSYEISKNFIELEGYGEISGPNKYKYTGKNTIFKFNPSNPFDNISFANFQETLPFKISNLCEKVSNLRIQLKPIKKQKQSLILTCEPNNVTMNPGEQRQFKLISIRINEELHEQALQERYHLTLYLNEEKYREIDLNCKVPPPQLQIFPKEVYFTCIAHNKLMKSSFKIKNKGYKEVLVVIKKPTNITFELDYKIENQSNKLTKLNNEMDVSVYYKSKKSVSFSVVLEVCSNFGKKYQVQLNGLTTDSPMFNCERIKATTTKGFSPGASSREINSRDALQSLSSLSRIEQYSNHEERSNSRFINAWFESIFPQFLKQSESYNIWLKNPKKLLIMLKYFRVQLNLLPKDGVNLSDVVEQLNKYGFSMHICRLKKLHEGCQTEWTLFIWLIISKELIHPQTLNWVNKTCQISIDNYESGYNHHKKIITDILTKILQPMFKNKTYEYQKLIAYISPTFPCLFKIQNKKQFIIAINILYHKLSHIKLEKVVISTLENELTIENKDKVKKPYWAVADQSFQAVVSSFSTRNLREQKRNYCWTIEEQVTIHLKMKNSINILLWNNYLNEPFKLYQYYFDKKPPILYNVLMECQDKCTQQWKLDFTCEMQSEYSFEFNGGLQFKCKMPDLRVIKSGQILEFMVVYTPNNFKEHHSVLTITNKYQEHVYNLKGKPLKSKGIEFQRMIRVHEGQRNLETFSIPEDSSISTQSTRYWVQQIDEQKLQEISLCEAKSNKKDIIIQVAFQFKRVVLNKEIIMQVSNAEMTFCKNIRLVINVIPEPVRIQAQVKGLIDKTITQKIPITNNLNAKQTCLIAFNRISKEEYLNSQRFRQEIQSFESHVGKIQDFQYKLSTVGKVILKPQEQIKLLLKYTPTTLNESYCQIKIKFQTTQNLFVYNFEGLPQLPFIDNHTLQIKCESEQQTHQSLKIVNKLKEKINFQVETNINFIAGAEQICLNSKQTYNYGFKLCPLHVGQFQGKIIFKNDKFCLIYPLKISVTNNKKIKKIKIQSKVRVTSKLQISLANRSNKDIEYEVSCNSQYLQYEPKFKLAANTEDTLILHYTPLFEGVMSAELKLYNKNMQEIVYHIELISQQCRESLKYECELSETKKIKLPIKNPTSIASQLQLPELPKYLSCSLSHQQFPISIEPLTIYHLELFYSPSILQKTHETSIQLKTNSIGNYKFNLQFTQANTKTIKPTFIYYNSRQEQKQLTKTCQIQFINKFDEKIQYSMSGMLMNKACQLQIEGPQTFVLNAYETKVLRCVAIIKQSQCDYSNEPELNIIVKAGEFSWEYPIAPIKIYQTDNIIQLTGLTHQITKTKRISLKHIVAIKDWIITDYPNYKDSFKLTTISSKEINLQCIINKNMEYNGYVIFYDVKGIAEKHHLQVKIKGKKYEKICIYANVGESGRTELKLKNGKGKGSFKVELKNNKMKQFDVNPKQGEFNEMSDNVISFDYKPVQYNGNKKAEAYIISEHGCYNFYIYGKFPQLK